MNYILITEISPIQVYKEPMTDVDIKKDLENLSLFNPIDLNKLETIPSFLTQVITEGTFKFIESVAIIENKKFGEKSYKINNIEFKILTEENYKNRYGEIDYDKRTN